jgi:hypothetical protein
MFRKLALAVLLLALPVLAGAQSLQAPAATPVYTTGSRLDVTTKYATSNSTGATLTITPASSNYVYITQIAISNCAGTTVTAAAPLSITSTNLGGGTTPVFQMGTAGTAGMCNPVDGYNGPIPLKSNAPGTAVTFVLPTFTANQVIRINVFYYEAL